MSAGQATGPEPDVHTQTVLMLQGPAPLQPVHAQKMLPWIVHDGD
jgi:hypothetical protein